MIIAINTRILSGHTASADLLQSCFEKIAEEQPGHSFVFISEKKNLKTATNLKNITYQIIEQQSGKPLFWKLWYNYKLPALLRKIKAGILINADGICSLRTQVPQFVLVNSIPLKEQAAFYAKNYVSFIVTNQAAFLKKALHIFAAGNTLQQKLAAQYKIAPGKITVLYPGCGENYQLLTWEVKEQVKDQYTAGKDYFLFTGPLGKESNLINLLKAFSFFKRRQKSNMQLVIVAEKSGESDGFTDSLSTYKYRKEVVLLNHLPAAELYKITAAAYAFVSPTLFEKDYSTLLNAMQCGVPLIVSNNETNKEIFDNAGLYTDPASFEDIADKMMLLFKDETKRAQHIENGLQRLQYFNLQKTATELWKAVMTAIH